MMAFLKLMQYIKIFILRPPLVENVSLPGSQESRILLRDIGTKPMTDRWLATLRHATTESTLHGLRHGHEYGPSIHDR
jgi:hypothetical protein